MCEVSFCIDKGASTFSQRHIHPPLVILLSRSHLWAAVVCCSRHGHLLDLVLLLKRSAHSKVSKLGDELCVDQNVVRFDIPMNDADSAAVQVRESLCTAEKNPAGHLESRGDEVRQISTSSKLEDQSREVCVSDFVIVVRVGFRVTAAFLDRFEELCTCLLEADVVRPASSVTVDYVLMV